MVYGVVVHYAVAIRANAGYAHVPYSIVASQQQGRNPGPALLAGTH